MKIKIVALCVAFSMIFAVGFAFADPTPADILETAFANYNLILLEIELSRISTTNWKGFDQNCACWIRRYPGGKNEMMFVLNRGDGLRPKADGVVMSSTQGIFDPPVAFQKRRSMKLKNSGYDDFSNGTELNYFDLLRLGGESIDSLEVSFWDGQPDERVKYPNENCSDCVIKFSIKAMPKNKQPGDYAFRVFHIGVVHEIVVILAVEYFDQELSLVKIQLNTGFEVLETQTSRIVREQQRTFITKQGETVITVLEHKLDAQFGELNEDALKNGQPK